MNGSGRRNVASARAKIALSAPMPSASVSAATNVKTGRCLHLTQRRRDVRHGTLPAIESHASRDLAFSPRPTQVRFSLQTSPSRASTISRAILLIHAAFDELTRAHFDVKGDLFVDFLGRVALPKATIAMSVSSFAVVGWSCSVDPAGLQGKTRPELQRFCVYSTRNATTGSTRGRTDRRCRHSRSRPL